MWKAVIQPLILAQSSPCSPHWTNIFYSFFFLFFFFTTREVTAVKRADKHKCDEASDLCCHLSLRPSLWLQRWIGTPLLVKVRWGYRYLSSRSLVMSRTTCVGECSVWSGQSGGKLAAVICQSEVIWDAAGSHAEDEWLLCFVGAVVHVQRSQTQSSARCFRKFNIRPLGTAHKSRRFSPVASSLPLKPPLQIKHHRGNLPVHLHTGFGSTRLKGAQS